MKCKYFSCRAILNPIERLTGQCKCGMSFCSVHRLAEKHDCKHDYKRMGTEIEKQIKIKDKRGLDTRC